MVSAAHYDVNPTLESALAYIQAVKSDYTTQWTQRLSEVDLSHCDHPDFLIILLSLRSRCLTLGKTSKILNRGGTEICKQMLVSYF